MEKRRILLLVARVLAMPMMRAARADLEGKTDIIDEDSATPFVSVHGFTRKGCKSNVLPNAGFRGIIVSPEKHIHI